ncbi:MAG: diguanylate cyclase [Betaproteobacteria bacterium]|nr:diguanylate cyclase [Betaproteobacteria bacterium]
MRTWRPSLMLVLIVAFALVAATPIACITLWLHAGIEGNLMNEVQDKNELLARNIATPVSEYLRAARGNLKVLAMLASRHEDAVGSAIRAQPYFEQVWLLPGGTGQALAWNVHGKPLSAAVGDDAAIAARVFSNPGRVDTVLHDPINGQPTVLLEHATPRGMLVGALDLQPLRALCRGIHFGKHGHCVITDGKGNIVEHPDSQWVREIKNISAWPIVKSGMEGHHGVMRFYSPFLLKNMISGYASVPGLHWVVLTPQPLSELTVHAKNLLRRGLTVALAGLGLAWLLASGLGIWLSRSLRQVLSGVQKVHCGMYSEPFPRLGRIAPREIEALRSFGVAMAKSVQQAMQLKDSMNEELERRVRAATDELEATNARLAAQAQLDELTGLFNRRGMWDTVARLTRNDAATPGKGSLILFDVDQFKKINDEHGHATGDRVLAHIARLLLSDIREGDSAIRFAGDEFIILMPHCNLETAQRRAQKVCERVAAAPLPVENGHAVNITLSMGVTGWEGGLTPQQFSEMLARADQAMYQAKHGGRNRVVVTEGI